MQAEIWTIHQPNKTKTSRKDKTHTIISFYHLKGPRKTKTCSSNLLSKKGLIKLVIIQENKLLLQSKRFMMKVLII